MIKINQKSSWYKLPRWKKRLFGFCSYFLWAFISLWNPEGADYVMFQDLSRSFYHEDE